jgi:hypothetical protein
MNTKGYWAALKGLCNAEIRSDLLTERLTPRHGVFFQFRGGSLNKMSNFQLEDGGKNPSSHTNL